MKRKHCLCCECETCAPWEDSIPMHIRAQYKEPIIYAVGEARTLIPGKPPGDWEPVCEDCIQIVKEDSEGSGYPVQFGRYLIKEGTTK